MMTAPFVEFFAVDGVEPDVAMKEFFSKHTQFRLISSEPIEGGIRAYYEIVA
jgi:hypothetical protein